MKSAGRVKFFRKYCDLGKTCSVEAVPRPVHLEALHFRPQAGRYNEFQPDKNERTHVRRHGLLLFQHRRVADDEAGDVVEF